MGWLEPGGAGDDESGCCSILVLSITRVGLARSGLSRVHRPRPGRGKAEGVSSLIKVFRRVLGGGGRESKVVWKP